LTEKYTSVGHGPFSVSLRVNLLQKIAENPGYSKILRELRKSWRRVQVKENYWQFRSQMSILD